MRDKSADRFRRFKLFAYRMISPVADPVKLLKAIPGYAVFFRDFFRYARADRAEKIGLFDLYPCIYNKGALSPFDPHYFYQNIWAFRKIYESKVDHHVDVGSKVDFVGLLSAVTRVDFIDIRPLKAAAENLNSVKGSVLAMPFDDNSVPSLSCLHVAEHIGLGRYGDPLNPAGTKEACKELARVLARGGNLYFSLPVGRPRLCFNAHRIHAPGRIIEYFSGLDLVELSGVTDQGNFIRAVDMSILENSDYACGLFHFRK